MILIVHKLFGATFDKIVIFENIAIFAEIVNKILILNIGSFTYKQRFD